MLELEKNTRRHYIYIYIVENTARTTRIKEITERKRIASEKNKARIEALNLTKRNFIYQFFSSIKLLIGSLTFSQLLGGASVITIFGGFFEKFKPFTKIITLFLNKK